MRILSRQQKKQTTAKKKKFTNNNNNDDDGVVAVVACEVVCACWCIYQTFLYHERRCRK